jgi:hypothetical protein
MNALGRRITGTLCGILVGLIYALVSGLINRVALPGVPLYTPSPGLALNILLMMLLGAVMGLITAWPEMNFFGIVLGGLLGGILFILQTILNTLGSESAGILVYFTTIYMFLPMIVVTLPVSGLIRWSINSLVPEDPSEPINIKKSILPLVVTLLLAGFVGGLGLFSPQVRADMRQMDALLQTGVKTTAVAALPQPFQSVDGFLDNAHGRYTLEWADGSDLFTGPRPVTDNDLDQGTVTIRFENGYTMVCLFIPTARQPVCERQ